nr:MAG TPA: hypothetical protein [Bacteriophage sp.]
MKSMLIMVVLASVSMKKVIMVKVSFILVMTVIVRSSGLLTQIKKSMSSVISIWC